MATFVNAASSQGSNTITLPSVVVGNFLIVFYAYTSGTPTTPSGTQTDWRQITFSPSAGLDVAFWTIATVAGTHTITIGGTGSNQGMSVAQYSGSDTANGVGTGVSQSLSAGTTSISCGSVTAPTGAILSIATFGQASGYSSSSGSTNRTSIDTNHRNFLSDNLSAHGSYTETGTITGSMTYGGEALVVPFVGTGAPTGTKFKGFIVPAICSGTTAGTSLNLPSSSAPVVNCNTGTNVNEGTLDFADGNTAQFGYLLPSDWDGTIAARIVFFSPSISGTVIFSLATACTSTTSGTATDDTAFNTATNFSTVTLGSTANAQHEATISSLGVTGCSAGNRVAFKIKRESDTATGVARLQGIELQVPRNL